MLFKLAIDNKMGIYLIHLCVQFTTKTYKDATENYYTISVQMEY